MKMHEMKSVDDATNGDVNEHFKLLNGGHSAPVTPRFSENGSDTELICYRTEDQQEAAQKKISEYVEGFTVHGLTKIFTGNKIEKLFWSVVLAFGVLLAAFVMQGLIRKYYRYEIYTELRSEVTSENLFPTFTICEENLFQAAYFAYCGIPNSGKGKPNCADRNNYANATISMTKKSWSNGIFNVSLCETWDGQECANNMYLKSMRRFNNTCIQLNWDGNLYDIYSHVTAKFQFIPPPAMGKKKPNIIVLSHDPMIHEIDYTSTVDIEPFKKYSIVIDKTHYQRLEYPYPSNCTNKKGLDIFPGKYERRQCIESYNYLDMYKTCGDVLDYIKQYIPKEYKEKYKRNQTYEAAKLCFGEYSNKRQKNAKECSFPCDELEFSMTPSFVDRPELRNNGSNDVYLLDMSYRIVDTYRILSEKALYGWDQMACEIGGFIGLVIGASVISFVEILVCVFLRSCITFKERISGPVVNKL